MRILLGLTCAMGIVTSGCGGDGDSGPASDVKGSIVDVHVLESGDMPFFRGTAQFEIAALVPKDDGSVREILGKISADGSFVIPQVPEIPYNLRFVEFIDNATVPPRIVINAPREIDLGRVFVGRPDALTIKTSPTDLALTAMGLEAWTSGDVLEMFSIGSGAAGELLPTTGNYPLPGVTSLDKYRGDAAKLLNPKLVQGSKGDPAVITQLAGTAATAAPYHSVRKVFNTPSFDQVDGNPTLISGEFIDVVQKNFAVDIDSPSFNLFASAVHPNATVAGKNVRLIAEPGGTRTTTAVPPNLLICEASTSAKLPTTFAYGNPFPPSWAEIVSTDIAFSMTHDTPTGISKSTIVTMGQYGPVESFPKLAVPVLSPPLDIRVNGMPAIEPLSGIGFTPTITFAPPEVGTPAVYIIGIRRLDPGGATTRTTAIFSTTETTFKIPEDTLDFGYFYYVRVSVRTTFDIRQPFKTGTTNAYASALTGLITP
ncbi:MAG TPA: hypothetical protein PK156_05255 [Polyangium sp.]|nr:hypothetical protein [Polyangium sp.]